MVLRKMFEPQKEDKTGSGDGKDYIVRSAVCLHSSPNIIRMIKSRRMRWTGHVERTWGGGERCIQGFGGMA